MSSGDHHREHGNQFDIFAPFRASIRTHLGELADEWMRGKISLVRHLSAQIEIETDLEKLKELRKELHDALLSEDDLIQMDTKLGKMLEMLKEHAVAFMEIRKLIKAAHDQHH